MKQIKSIIDGLSISDKEKKVLNDAIKKYANRLMLENNDLKYALNRKEEQLNKVMSLI